MGRERTTLEIIAPSVEEAISKGAEELGVSPEKFEVEVLDEGSKGLFGLGGRQARIRLTLTSGGTESHTKLIPQEEYQQSTPEIDVLEETETEGDELEVSRLVVLELLNRMKVNAFVESSYLEPEDSHDQRIVCVDIEGDDLSILIGRKSETLNALQYLSGLIISKKLGYWLPLVIDVQGYRERRQSQLRRLAQKMADQAIQTGRRQYLEPMPANERRMIHLELRDNELIGTESVGEEPNRKVSIFLRK